MSEYTQALDWCEHLDGIRYVSTREIVWYIGSLDSGLRQEVPAGEVFDGTIPWWACWLFSPHNRKYLKAFLLHDYFLRIGWDRFTAGAQFHQALFADGAGKMERAIMTVVVMFFKYQ